MCLQRLQYFYRAFFLILGVSALPQASALEASCTDFGNVYSFIEEVVSNPTANRSRISEILDFMNGGCSSDQLASDDTSVEMTAVSFLGVGHANPFAKIAANNTSPGCPTGSETVSAIKLRSEGGIENLDFPLYVCEAETDLSGVAPIPDSQEKIFYGGSYGSYKDYTQPYAGPALWHNNPYNDSNTCPSGYTAYLVHGNAYRDWSVYACYKRAATDEVYEFAHLKYRGFRTDPNECPAGSLSHQISGSTASPIGTAGVDFDAPLHLCLQEIIDDGGNEDNRAEVLGLNIIGLDTPADTTPSLLSDINPNTRIAYNAANYFTLEATMSLDGTLVDADRFATTPNNQQPLRVRFEAYKDGTAHDSTSDRKAPYYIKSDYYEQGDVYQFLSGSIDSVGLYRIVITPTDQITGEQIGDTREFLFEIFDPNQDGQNDSTDVTPPNTPTNLQLISASTNSLSLKWQGVSDPIGPSGNDVSGVARYEVFLNGNFALSSTNAMSTVNNLEPQTDYFVKVRAVDNAGNEGAFSSESRYSTEAADDDDTDPSLDTEGWTILTPSADSRIIYVSSSGNDSNDGLSPNRPLKSLNAGYQLLRSGYPDHLLLERGSRWVNEPIALNFTKGGRSPSEKMLIGAYGTGSRPILEVIGVGTAFSAQGSDEPQRKHLAITGLHFLKKSANSGKGINVVGDDFDDVLIEDMLIEGFFNGISFDRANQTNLMEDIVVRRNVIIDSRGGSHAQGLFSRGVLNLTIEENIFDRNGWDYEQGREATGSIFAHNIYIQREEANTSLSVRNNLIMRGASHGIQARNGGIIENNFVYQNAIGILAGNEGLQADENQVYVRVNDNVVMEPLNISSSLERGFGIDVQNIFNDSSVSNNILSDTMRLSGVTTKGISLQGRYDATRNEDADISSNIVYNFSRSFIADDDIRYSRNIRVFNNDFSTSVGDRLIMKLDALNGVVDLDFFNNRYFSPISHAFTIGAEEFNLSQWNTRASDNSNSFNPDAAYPNANRNLLTYAQSLGLSNLNQIYSEIRQQRRGRWDLDLTSDAINDYIRAGFGR